MKTLSLNEGSVITNWKSFESYAWQNPAKCYEGKLVILHSRGKSKPYKIFSRSRSILESTESKRYALGPGNSIPSYVPHENYLAMISAALLKYFCTRPIKPTKCIIISLYLACLILKKL